MGVAQGTGLHTAVWAVTWTLTNRANQYEAVTPTYCARLKSLLEAIDRECGHDREGPLADYKPLVFLLIDGDSGDVWEELVPALRKAKLRILATGEQVNVGQLTKLTPHVLLMSDVTPDSLIDLLIIGDDAEVKRPDYTAQFLSGRFPPGRS
jgi:hypothetical protein